MEKISACRKLSKKKWTPEHSDDQDSQDEHDYEHIVDSQMYNIDFDADKDYVEPTAKLKQQSENINEEHHKGNIVDKVAQVAKYAWYWGPVSREETEEMLRGQLPGSYLVRDGLGDVGHMLTLSFVDQTFQHLKIKLRIGSDSVYFYNSVSTDGILYPDIISLIAGYQDIGIIKKAVYRQHIFAGLCSFDEQHLLREMCALPKEAWYFGPLSPNQVEYELSEQSEGTGVVYDCCEQAHQILQLSVVQLGLPTLNLPIKHQSGFFVLNDIHTRSFKELFDHKIRIRGGTRELVQTVYNELDVIGKYKIDATIKDTPVRWMRVFAKPTRNYVL
ncbi:hypothetical protein CAPTEDRAFT_196922 [Capitella teleta]|uniref:SH2 domain-containing protein n=1 Tax=Capitella teleta TaxID=283909 RepID=R7UJ48_CAPTE|nr:hypothetical protein CAPTEDRAFT_196922 [Capitella teleta]|eukprot:ELU06230.1 hypothetical protein CAPTEDRAFT_196922 [Capitella teleta]